MTRESSLPLALLFPLVAVLAAFAVGSVFVLAIGDNPLETYGLLLGSALWWPDGIGHTLFLATPLIFTGLAVSTVLSLLVAALGLWWFQKTRRGFADVL